MCLHKGRGDKTAKTASHPAQPKVDFPQSDEAKVPGRQMAGPEEGQQGAAGITRPSKLCQRYSCDFFKMLLKASGPTSLGPSSVWWGWGLPGSSKEEGGRE